MKRTARPPTAFARRKGVVSAAPTVLPTHVASAINLALSAALWIAVSSALLYSQGRAYRDAYLITYGVDAELLPWDRGALSYWGMVVGVQGFFESVLLPTVAISMWFVLVWMVKEWLLKRYGSRTTSRAPTSEPRSIPFVIWGCFGVAAATAFVGVVLLGFQWIQYKAERRGEDDAQREMRMINNCVRSIFNSSDFRPVHVERAIAGGRETYDGFIATCTDKRCALYDPLQHRTQVVPLDQIIRFDTVRPEQVYWQGSSDVPPK